MKLRFKRSLKLRPVVLWPAALVSMAMVVIPVNSPGAIAESNRVGEDNAKALGSKCRAPRSAVEVGFCALRIHPKVRLRKMRKRIRIAGKREAGQRPNPELDARATGGGGDGSVELALTHTFELGGKRNARLASASTRIQESTILLRMAQREAVEETLTLLVRLRHTRDEMQVQSEARRTYSRIVNRIRRYPYLSPSSRAALAVFRTARSRAQLSLSALEQEETSLLSRLRLIMGQRLELRDRALPPLERRRWPVPGKALGEPLTIKLARVRLAMARAGLKLERSNAWPDLAIGPAFDYRRSSLARRSVLGASSDSALTYGFTPRRRTSGTEFGLSFRISLPLYQRNQGGVRRARSTIEMSDLTLKIAIQRATGELVRLEKSYLAGVRVLEAARTDLARQRRRHGLLERHILRGTIQPSLVIELHREMLEYTERRNRTELNTRLLLFQLRMAQGHSLSREFMNETFNQ